MVLFRLWEASVSLNCNIDGFASRAHEARFSLVLYIYSQAYLWKWLSYILSLDVSGMDLCALFVICALPKLDTNMCFRSLLVRGTVPRSLQSQFTYSSKLISKSAFLKPCLYLLLINHCWMCGTFRAVGILRFFELQHWLGIARPWSPLPSSTLRIYNQAYLWEWHTYILSLAVSGKDICVLFVICALPRLDTNMLSVFSGTQNCSAQPFKVNLLTVPR